MCTDQFDNRFHPFMLRSLLAYLSKMSCPSSTMVWTLKDSMIVYNPSIHVPTSTCVLKLISDQRWIRCGNGAKSCGDHAIVSIRGTAKKKQRWYEEFTVRRNVHFVSALSLGFVHTVLGVTSVCVSLGFAHIVS